jgi:hypothetical protein
MRRLARDRFAGCALGCEGKYSAVRIFRLCSYAFCLARFSRTHSAVTGTRGGGPGRSLSVMAAGNAMKATASVA